MELILVGMRFHEPTYSNSNIKVGTLLGVRAEPENPVDPRALAVYSDKGKVGHIRAADIDYARDCIFDRLEKCGYSKDTIVYFEVTKVCKNYLLMEYKDANWQKIKYDSLYHTLQPNPKNDTDKRIEAIRDDIADLERFYHQKRLAEEKHFSTSVGNALADTLAGAKTANPTTVGTITTVGAITTGTITTGTIPIGTITTGTISGISTTGSIINSDDWHITKSNLTSILSNKVQNKVENKMSFNTANLKDSFFRELKNIAFDLQSGKLGVITKDGISVYSGDGVSVNPITDMGFTIPAFAMRVAVGDLKEGDILITNGDPVFFKEFIKDKDGKNTSGYKTVSLNGTVQEVGNVTNLFFGKNSVLAVKNVFGEGNSDGMNPMMMLALTGALGDGNSKIDPIMLMAMSGGFGGSSGSMNPMMLALLLAKK